MSSVVKSVKKAVKSVTSEAGRAVDKTVDLSKEAVDALTVDLVDAGKDFFQPQIPKIKPTATVGPGTIDPGPNVDLAATEGSRRNTGVAKGSRKLRVPLGGLR